MRQADPCRGGLITATSVSLATLIPVSLHQLGIVERLPDPPLAVFDSNAITSSKMAHPFGIPDSLLGIASYGVTLGLAIISPRGAVIRRALAAKLAFDGGLAATNSVRQVIVFRKLCSWCMGTAACTFLSVWMARHFIRREM
jgi:uncharacterized membrane protein